MDILIKNMEMPKKCAWIDNGELYKCFCFESCKVREQHVRKQDCSLVKEPDCPLVALPEHGALKDYDKIKKVLTEIFDANADSLVYHILSLIEETDTIVEASK